ncbi:MAG: VWA domain-containing protein [Blastocatellia bacterium]
MTTRSVFICCLIFSVTFLALAAPQSSDQKSRSAAQNTAKPQSQAAQNPARQDDVVKIGVTLVQIDAIVTDKQGRQVTDLNKDDFEIYEDGKRQLVTNFSYFKTESAEAPPVSPPQPTIKGAPRPPSAPAIALKPEQVRRSIAIVIDDAMSFSEVDASRQALRKFVDEQMQPGDLVAILRTQGSMGALQRFTSDKRVLHAAVNHIRWMPSNHIDVFDPITPTSEAQEAMGRKREGNKTEDYNGQSGPIRESRDALALLRARMTDVHWPLFQTLASVARGMQVMPGRKSVILFSPGFSMKGLGLPWVDQLQLLIERLNRTAISVYPIDSRGLVVPTISAEEDMSASDFMRRDDIVTGRLRGVFEYQGGLEYLAHETGGLPFFNRNKLSDGVRQALGDQNGYYLLGYVPQESSFKRGAGKLPEFRKITVKVKRDGLRVRSRSGYLGATNEEIAPAPLASSQSLIRAVLSPFNAGDVRLRMTPLFGLDANQQSVARALLHIDVRDLSFSEEADGSRRTTLEVAAFTFNEKGNIDDNIIRTYTLQVPKDAFEAALQQGFVCMIDLPVKKAGGVQMHTAVRDKTSGRLGSASEVILIPDVKRGLALSGIALSGTNKAEGEQSKAADGAAAEQANSVIASKANAAVRQFQAGSQMHYELEVYNASLDAASHRPRLTRRLRIWRDGAMVMETPASLLDLGQQPDWKVIAITGSLTLTQGVKPGQYAIEVLIEDELAAPRRRTVTQVMDFEVIN